MLGLSGVVALRARWWIVGRWGNWPLPGRKDPRTPALGRNSYMRPAIDLFSSQEIVPYCSKISEVSLAAVACTRTTHVVWNEAETATAFQTDGELEVRVSHTNATFGRRTAL